MRRGDALLRRLRLRYPIIAAPMAGAAGPELAVAAMRTGALGSLPCALLTPDQVREQLAQVRAAAQGPVNLNFFCHAMPAESDDRAWRAMLAPYYAAYGVQPPKEPPPLRLPFSDAMCAVVEAERPEVVSFHFGLPDTALLERVRASGAAILASATTPREARWLDARGVDAVIAQGAEAGGHASYFLDGNPATHMGLMALLPQVVDAVNVPVIAAGGIADARGIAAALLLGASAVQLGTAFLPCTESKIAPFHRAALASADAEHTQFTTLFSGRPARGMANRLMRDLGAMPEGVPPFPYASAALSTLRSAAEAKGDSAFSSLWAGQAARLGAPGMAGALIERLAEETEALLRNAASLVAEQAE